MPPAAYGCEGDGADASRDIDTLRELLQDGELRVHSLALKLFPTNRSSLEVV